MKPSDIEMTAEQARARFAYDAETGAITRLKSRDPNNTGRPAGYKHRTGYIVVKVGERQVLAHRLAWLLHYGEWPGELFIDHINRDKTDNRIANLRLATNAENLANRVGSWGASGLRGVQYDKRKKTGRKWFAVIKLDYGEKYLGCFHTPEEASAAYRAAAVKARGEFAVPLNDGSPA